MKNWPCRLTAIVVGCTARPLKTIRFSFDSNGRRVNTEAVNVILPTLLEEFARQKVAAGDFESVDDVVCEGLRLLQLREQWNCEAGAKIDVGWEQAKSGQLLSSVEVRKNLASRKEDLRRQNR